MSSTSTITPDELAKIGAKKGRHDSDYITAAERLAAPANPDSTDGDTATNKPATESAA